MRHSAARDPLGITNPPSGSAEPLRFAPASSGGSTEPKEIDPSHNFKYLTGAKVKKT